MASTLKFNWLVIAVIFLAVVNLAALGFIWLEKQKVNDRPHGNRDARDFLVNELALDKKQTQQFDSLRTIHFKEMNKRREEMRQLKDRLFDGLKIENDTAANTIAQQIGILQKTIDLNTFQHFAALRKICTEEQKQRFDRVIQDILRNMGRAPGGRPEGPPPGEKKHPPPL